MTASADSRGERPAMGHGSSARGGEVSNRGFGFEADGMNSGNEGGERPRVVAFGGGTGMSTLLSGLRKFTSNLTAVVTVTDNGGSSGRLRDDFDMLPPGDIRNCLIALADVDPLIGDVFQYRFRESEFKGHCFGNLFITVLTKIVGNFEDSISTLNRLLHVRGRVLPAAGEKVSLVAHHSDGSKSTGEVQISRSRKRIERIELRPGPISASTEIIKAVDQADLFLFGPGSLFTSVVPNLLLEGLIPRIEANGSPRVYIGNIMTQPGETEGFRLSDHVRALQAHVGTNFPDCVVAHVGQVREDVVANYRAAGAAPVENDLKGSDEFGEIRVIERDFYDGSEVARHDPDSLARALFEELLSPGDGTSSPTTAPGGATGVPASEATSRPDGLLAPASKVTQKPT